MLKWKILSIYYYDLNVIYIL